MNKKIALIVSAVVMTALIAAGGTLAYFTTSATAANVVTMGNVKIQIVEQQPKEGILSTVPGGKYAKPVSVKNTGDNTAYIRMSINHSWQEGEQEYNPELIEIEVDPNSGWVKGDDGYFYYQTAVKAGESTKNIFDNFRLSTAVDNSYAGIKGQISLTAHAIQADNFQPATNVTGNIVSWGTVGNFGMPG